MGWGRFKWAGGWGAEALALLHMTTKRSHPWEGPDNSKDKTQCDAGDPPFPPPPRRPGQAKERRVLCSRERGRRR